MADSDSRPGPWKVLSTRELFKTRIFRFRSDQCELPDGRVMPNYYVMEFPDWVNVVPITDDNRIVMIEQYRQAAGQLFYEIPGGSTDRGTEPPYEDEDPKRAALRELREETGYVPEDIRLVGIHHPNPAMQNNRMHTFIAYGCQLLAEVELDPFEDIRVVTKSIPEVFEMIAQGKITHSIVLASLLLALPTLGFGFPRP